MNKEQAKEEVKGKLKQYIEMITTPSKGKNLYICPICNSGTGKNKTGAFSLETDGKHWKCFSCGAGGDILELIGQHEHLTNYIDKLKRACEIFGIPLDDYYKKSTGKEDFKAENQNQVKTEQYTNNNIHTTTYTQEQTDYTNYFLQAHKNINKTDYPEKRGLSKEIIDRFNIGFDPEWRHPKTPKAPTTPRLIIPTSKYSYLARDTREIIPEYQKRFSKSKAGSIHIYNIDIIATATKPIFIVEGELDALSIIEAGGEAIGLGTITKIRDFLNHLLLERPKKPLILCLDSDEAGEKATEQLIEGLKQQKIKYIKADYLKKLKVKDSNEALIKNKSELIKEVENMEKEAEIIEKELSEEERTEQEEYLKTATAYKLQGFIEGIADSVNTSYIPTNFEGLDNALEGGLYEGLYIIGAISSLGKTTFAIQIGDQIAQTGQDVLIFSLEMASSEIMAKSISRHTIQDILKNGGDMRNAKTTRGITTGKRYIKYNATENKLIKDSIEAYGRYAQNIFINEGVGDIGAEKIRQIITDHIKYTNKKPVVIIDYLQIIAPYEVRATDKQNIDKAVLELKRISRDYKIPIIGVSSFNRANYNTPVTMEAFKESGAIEYSSDVLIGLQLRGAGEKEFKVNEAKQKNPREVELVILKNRNGASGITIGYKYYPAFNLFVEEKQEKQEK